MAEVFSLQKKILRAAGQYLDFLKTDQRGRVVVSDFPEDLLPSGISLAAVKNFLFNIARTTSLEELLKRKEEIAGLLDQIDIDKEAPATTTVIPPREELIVRPAEQEKGEKRIKITSFEDIQEMLDNLTRQIRRLSERKTAGEEKETTIYKEEPLTDTERKVNEAIEAVETKLNQELKAAVPKYPQLERKLKTPEEITKVVREAAQAVKENLITITDTNQAINAVQLVLQQKTDLSRDTAYNLAKEAVAVDPNIVQTANRYRTLEYIRRNQLHEKVTDAFRTTLAEVGFSHHQVNRTISLLDAAIDPLLTEGFTRRETDKATEIFKATICPVLSKDGLSAKDATLASEALAVSKTTKILQDLARTTSSWDTVPVSLQKIAFETTVPEETKQVASEIKKFVSGFGLGPIPSAREEVKVEQLASEASKALVKKRVVIFARARERGLRARIPVEQIIQEETPQIVERVIRETLVPGKYGTDFVQKVENGLKGSKLPAPLLKSTREVLETPPPQLTPAEKEKAIAIIKKLITQEILLGRIAPKDEASIEEIARTAVEEMIKEIQASPCPIERLNQARAVAFQGLHSTLEQCAERYPSLVRKIEKGLTAAAAAERIPPTLFENLQKIIYTLPPKLRPWEERELAKLIEQEILPLAEIAAYRKSIARGEDQGFLSPITPPEIVARTSEERMACSFLTSQKKDKGKLSEKAQFLIEEAEKTAPGNKTARRFFDRLFRLLTGKKDPSQTLDGLAGVGPGRMNFPSQFRQEISRRFINNLFWEGGWKKVDRSTGESYSRFGRNALKNAFSRVTSPIKKLLTEGTKKALRSVGRLLGKAIRPALSMLGKLLAPALNAITGLLGKLLPALLSLALQAAGALMNLLSLVGSTVGLPVTLIVLAAIVIIIVIFLIIRAFFLPGAYVDYLAYLEPEHGSCDLFDPIMSSGILSAFFQQAGETFKVPAGVIAGVAYIEGEHLWGYGDISIVAYSQPEAQDPINCDPNQCGARGPMQFLTGENVNPDKCPQACLEKDDQTGQCLRGLDVWSQYKEAVNEALNEGRDPHVCNIKDSIFAASKMLKQKSQTTPDNDCAWNKEQVYNAARGFYGKCEYTAEWGGEIFTGDYCRQVWQYYVNVSTIPTIYP